MLLAVLLIPAAWAKPRFRVLANVAGGLWNGVSLDAKGDLWGVTNGGGAYGLGSVFELTRRPNGKWKLTTIHSFGSTDGDFPVGTLIFDVAGNAYGTTLNSVVGGGGMVYELAPGSGGWTFTVLHDFEIDGVDGDHPSGLVMDAAGNLYGVGGAGANDAGVVFELSPGSGGWTEQVLYNFGSYDYDAEFPSGPLLLDKTGNIYGGATTGGKYSFYGAVFELEKSNGWAESLLWQFDGTDGQSPLYGVAFDQSRNLLGTGGAGPANSCYGYPCGVAFKVMRPKGGRGKEAVLYDFPDPKEGFDPSSGLVPDRSGGWYGTTGIGGIGSCSEGCGVVYRLSPITGGRWKYTALHRFDGADGYGPGGGLAIDGKGNVYGTAYDVVYEVAP